MTQRMHVCSLRLFSTISMMQMNRKQSTSILSDAIVMQSLYKSKSTGAETYNTTTLRITTLLYNEIVVDFAEQHRCLVKAGNTKGGSISVPLTSCLTGLESAV